MFSDVSSNDATGTCAKSASYASHSSTTTATKSPYEYGNSFITINYDFLLIKTSSYFRKKIKQQINQFYFHFYQPTLSEQLQDPSQASTQPLEEINQEDLAAILPDAAFDGFEDSESGRLVSKAIERMSLGADSDSSENVNERNPVPVYSSSLLQQFVEKTALLSEPRKRRTGGVSVKQNVMGKQRETEYVSSSNVSPDSGIQSVDNSPLHLLNPVSPLATQGSITTANVITSPSRNGMNTKFIAPSSKGRKFKNY